MEFHIKVVLLSFAISILLGLIIIPILKNLKVGLLE